jgi:mRNA interferase MazF
MGKFVKGDIVVLPFPFSDLSSSKRRPALVLVDLMGKDVILCQITSKTVRDDMSVVIDIADVENGSLNDVSNVRPNKLFTADESILLYKLGNLSQSKLDEVVDTLVDMFKGA